MTGTPVGRRSQAESPVRARYLMDSLQAAGADLIKNCGPPREAYLAMMAEARRLGIPVGGYLAGSLDEALDLGQRTFEHVQKELGGDDAAAPVRCTALAERLRRHNAWLVPGPLLLSASAPAREWRARLRYWPDSVTRHVWVEDSMSGLTRVEAFFSRRPEPSVRAFVQLAQRAGLPLLAGSDAAPIQTSGLVPGFSLHNEVLALAELGLSPLAALQTATINPAQYLGATDSLGTIAPGKLADLVLLDANPLGDIRNLQRIRAVVANGRYFDRAALDALLTAVEQRGAAHWGGGR